MEYLMKFKLQNYLPISPKWNSLLSSLHAWRRIGYWPNTTTPKTFNEHILAQKKKFGGDVKLAREITDKHLFKLWLKKGGFEDLIVPTIGVFDKIEDLYNFKITQDLIIKPTHSSGDLMVRPASGGEKFSQKEILTMKQWLNTDYYKRSREPSYKGLIPRIIIEETLLDSQQKLPNDFKIFCSSGNPFMIQIDLGRFDNHTRQLYSLDWQLLPYTMCYPRNETVQPRPVGISAAIELARTLSAEFEFCRVDFYILSDTNLKLGEITFFPGNGAELFSPASGDQICGNLIKQHLNN